MPPPCSFPDDPSLTNEQYFRKLEDHLLKAMEGESIEVPDDVWENGDILGFCWLPLPKQS